MKNNTAQVSDILHSVLSYAQLDFSQRAQLTGQDDEMDALAAGVNMLGEELQASALTVKEKDVLLREIHHRVKNNLQLISSILSLQSSFIKDELAKEKFAECQTRIQSIALLHEKLYLSVDIRHVEINDYLLGLCRSLLKTFPKKHVEFSFSPLSEDYYSHIDALLPLGLILNELVTNTMKHAFPENESGTLNVGLRYKDDDKRIELRVSDNGIGIQSSNLGFETLGFQLIHELSDQIDATLSIETNSGTNVKISFIKVI